MHGGGLESARAGQRSSVESARTSGRAEDSAETRFVAIAVVSADGRLTDGERPGSAFASSEDQAHFRDSIRRCSALIMGRTTYEVAQPFMKLVPGGPARFVMTSRPDEFENVPGLLEFTAAAPPALAARCRSEHPGTIAILGGSQVYSAFADAGLIDEWQITVEPVLFGAGLPLLARPLVQRLRLLETRNLNASTVLLRYVR